MRSSDWSSDVCSSDLARGQRRGLAGQPLIHSQQEVAGLAGHALIAVVEPEGGQGGAAASDRSPSLRLEPFEAGAYAMLGAGVRQQQGFHVVSRKARRRPMLLPVNARLFLVQPLAEGVRVVGGAGRDDERTDRKSTRLNSSH